jgi:hypothetical protein
MAAQQDSGEGLNPVWLASNKLRRRKYDECIAICTTVLEKNPYDQVPPTPPSFLPLCLLFLLDVRRGGV